MKFYITLITFCFLGLSSTQFEERTILWSSDRPLVWSDFQGKPDDTLNLAVTHAFMSKTPYKKNLYFRYVIACFDKKKSWVVNQDKPDSLILIHEQGHFDIVEIYTRKFNYEFKDIKMTAREKELEVQTKRFDEIAEEMIATQVEYDKKAPNNPLEQIKWNKWIAKQLDSIPKLEFD